MGNGYPVSTNMGMNQTQQLPPMVQWGGQFAPPPVQYGAPAAQGINYQGFAPGQMAGLQQFANQVAAQGGQGAPGGFSRPYLPMAMRTTAAQPGGTPFAGGYGGGDPRGPNGPQNAFMQNANLAQYGGWLGSWMNGQNPGSAQQAQVDPNAWANGPNYRYSPNGQTPFAGIDPNSWADRMDQLNATLPWAQMSQQDQRTAFEQEMARRQFDANQAQQQWNNSLTGGQQNIDNAWRQRQMDLQALQQEFDRGMAGRQMTDQEKATAFNQYATSRGLDLNQNQQQFAQQFQQQQAATSADQWNRQFGASNDQFNRQFDAGRQDAQFNQGMAQNQFNAGRQDQAWSQDFQNRQFNAQTGQWEQQFGANRQDAAFNQDLANRQFNAQTGQWDQQFGANRADAAFNQGLARDQYNAGRQDTQWGQDFQNRQFDANRQDVGWNQNFQQNQFGEDTRRYNQDFAQQKAVTDWNQAFAGSQFDWQKQNSAEQNRLAEQGQYLGAFGRKFGPNVGSM